MEYTKQAAEVLIEIGAAIYGATLLILMYLWEKRKEKENGKNKHQNRNIQNKHTGICNNILL